MDRLRAENQRLTSKLAQTQAALSIMGKAHELLESLAESSEPPTGSTR
jgi:transposase